MATSHQVVESKQTTQKALFEAIAANLEEVLAEDAPINMLQRGVAIKGLAEAYRLAAGGPQ